MMSEPREVIERVLGLYESLLTGPRLRKGERWEEDWAGWDEEAWQAGKPGVYVLWAAEDDRDREIVQIKATYREGR